MKHISCAIIFFILIFNWSKSWAQSSTDQAPVNTRLETTGQWFLAFQHRNNDGADNQNAFVLKRGYITFSKTFNPKLAVRFTQDIITDQEGDDAGNIEMRLKYCYLKVSPFTEGILSHSFLEAGMVHRPYLDFEEKINRYRVQGTMFLERYKVINSADFGITLFSLLGGPLDKEFQSRVSSAYPGRYGSIAFGIYNGGGYHALEMNRNKTVEGRITLRPLPASLPGLQLTYAFVEGKGNRPVAPQFQNSTFLLSFESYRVITGIQYTKGVGNMWGTLVSSDNTPIPLSGVSAFSEVFILPSKVATFLRYDYFRSEAAFPLSADERERGIAGISWYFHKKSKLLIDADIVRSKNKYERTYEVVIEILF
jgi:hypothetical protein